MKRYETMSKEEIMDFFVECQNMRCEDCAKRSRTTPKITGCARDYLQEEVPEPLMVRRYQNICCKQDLVDALNTVHEKCRGSNCNLCQYDGKGCRSGWLVDYLCELEPEREKEWYLNEKYDKSEKA